MPNSKAEVILMRQFDDLRDEDGVPDPYYGGIEGFENIYNILTRSCKKFLDHIIETKAIMG